MILKINRKECLEKHPNFPTYEYTIDDEIYFFPKAKKSYVLSLNSKSARGNIKQVSIETTKLMNSLGVDELIFLGDTPTPWLRQNNPYKPVNAALQFLEDNKVGKRFNGALVIDIFTLSDFLVHISWLARCCASLPYFNFLDEQQNYLGYICKYGNLHFFALNKKSAEKLSKALMLSKFKQGDRNDCYDRFSKTGTISHRKIIV